MLTDDFKVANREGFGNILAGGVMRAAEHLGGEAKNMAIYTGSGNTPRMHDHRCAWPMIIDTVTSDKGRDMDSALLIFRRLMTKVFLPPRERPPPWSKSGGAMPLPTL